MLFDNPQQFFPVSPVAMIDSPKSILIEHILGVLGKEFFTSPVIPVNVSDETCDFIILSGEGATGIVPDLKPRLGFHVSLQRSDGQQAAHEENRLAADNPITFTLQATFGIVKMAPDETPCAFQFGLTSVAYYPIETHRLRQFIHRATGYGLPLTALPTEIAPINAMPLITGAIRWKSLSMFARNALMSFDCDLSFSQFPGAQFYAVSPQSIAICFPLIPGQYGNVVVRLVPSADRIYKKLDIIFERHYADGPDDDHDEIYVMGNIEYREVKSIIEAPQQIAFNCPAYAKAIEHSQRELFKWEKSVRQFQEIEMLSKLSLALASSPRQIVKKTRTLMEGELRKKGLGTLADLEKMQKSLSPDAFERLFVEPLI
jgi:hypothetical protein